MLFTSVQAGKVISAIWYNKLLQPAAENVTLPTISKHIKSQHHLQMTEIMTNIK